ncbi:MAG TPA: DUF5063 domain-containing protein [Bacteroidales bacterium]|jgi:hypothetical protein|nr:DUF5063 domain-containing protein [Bacteroidales bacterium]
MITKGILEFITISKELCAFLELSEYESKRIFIDKTQKLLSLLYLKALVLNSHDDVDGYCEQFVTEEQWNYIQQSIQTTLGDHDVYIEVTSVENKQSEKDTMPLSEALADVYQDIREFIDRMRTDNDEMREVAVYECLQNFGMYWGPRVLSIMQEFHVLLYSVDSEIDNEE